MNEIRYEVVDGMINISSSELSEINEKLKNNLKYNLNHNNLINYTFNNDELVIEIDDTTNQSTVDNFNGETFLSRCYNAVRSRFINFLLVENYISYGDISVESMINFVGLYNVNYIFELKKDEMPIISIMKSKISLSKKRIFEDNGLNDWNNFNTEFNLITVYQLLGCFAKVDVEFLDELKGNGVTEIEDIYHNKIDVELLIGKKVIIICRENINELYNNVKNLDDLQYKEYFNLECDLENENDLYIVKGNMYPKFTILEIKNMFKDKKKLIKMVLYHELGHAVFDCINTDDYELKEKQANYFASIADVGEQDKLLALYNNKIGLFYKNPLLQSHKYLMTDVDYNKSLKRLYGE